MNITDQTTPTQILLQAKIVRDLFLASSRSKKHIAKFKKRVKNINIIIF